MWAQFQLHISKEVKFATTPAISRMMMFQCLLFMWCSSKPVPALLMASWLMLSATAELHRRSSSHHVHISNQIDLVIIIQW